MNALINIKPVLLVDVESGVSINAAVEQAGALADFTTLPVIFDFDGMRVTVEPESDVKQIVEDWLQRREIGRNS